ncbi:uncharacterized protein LOC118450602 isoform X2 [Vespa mandarinia]|uniref:uncharacterized protein LOC118450602 isoform X2 n=1 Tax=Vespa mandarinia TaxID=7446 RepID=UPI0016140DD6|nr:uncharacterized protein LOC118450602 isoform X2 [Vespa mandarinia]
MCMCTSLLILYVCLHINRIPPHTHDRQSKYIARVINAISFINLFQSTLSIHSISYDRGKIFFLSIIFRLIIIKHAPNYNFPRIKLKNITCVHCKCLFIVREVLTLRGKQIPLLMECGHSICYGCAKLYPDISCSLCCEHVEINEKKSEMYPLNIYTLGLLFVASHQPYLLEEPDISFTQTVVPKARLFQIAVNFILEKGHCHECEIEATLRCPQCNALYCQTCYSKIHGKALQNHSKILINEIKDMPLTIFSVCSNTCNEYAGYFCNDCKISSCSHCMLRYHSKHNHISLLEKNQELMDSFNKAYNDVAESLHRVLQTLKLSFHFLEFDL